VSRVEIVKLVHGWGTVPADGSDGLLVHTSLLSALQTRAERNEGLTPPFDFWLIDGVKVAEPHAQGGILGTTADILLNGKKVLRMSQLSYDHLTDPNTPIKPVKFTR
jgi:hypothetical protein